MWSIFFWSRWQDIYLGSLATLCVHWWNWIFDQYVILKHFVFVSFQLLFSDKYFISVCGSLPINENSPWFCIIYIEWLSCQFFSSNWMKKYTYQPNIYEVHTKLDALVYCKVVWALRLARPCERSKGICTIIWTSNSHMWQPVLYDVQTTTCMPFFLPFLLFRGCLRWQESHRQND